MTLKVKEAPTKLLPQVIETIWPGDDAVDLEASDLVAWCRRGGREGLRLRDTGTPTIIRWKPLGEMAWTRVLTFLRDDSVNAFPIAARHGIVAIEGMRLRWDSFDDVPGLAIETMDELSAFAMPLPYADAIYSVTSAATGKETGSDEPADLVRTTLPQVLGAHIVAATFRARGTVV